MCVVDVNKDLSNERERCPYHLEMEDLDVDGGSNEP